MKKIIAVLFMKKLFLLVLALIMLCSVTCFAAPETVNANDTGTNNGLIVIKKPETTVSSTTKQKYTLSAVSLQGVEVALYSYNSSTGKFHLKRDAAGNPAVTTVGASGIYMRDVDLAMETNYLLVRAQYGDGNYQIVRLDITLLNQSLLDSIKGFAANFQSIFGGW